VLLLLLLLLSLFLFVCVVVVLSSVVCAEIEQMCQDVSEWNAASPDPNAPVSGEHLSTPPDALAWSSTLQAHHKPMVPSAPTASAHDTQRGRGAKQDNPRRDGWCGWCAQANRLEGV